MFVKAHTASVIGVSAITVNVEVNLSRGIGMFLVGLPDSSVKESQDRIRSAFENSDFKMPGKRLVVNLAPADVRKEGASFDLPIAVGILAATEQISADLIDKYIIIGELSLDGTLRAVRGVLPIAVMAKEQGFRGIIVPADNALEAAVVEGLDVIGADSLKEVADMLCGRKAMTPTTPISEEEQNQTSPFAEDFCDVKGQENVKRALEIAAAGGHNVIMIGAPGSGKTMLARRMPTIMPPMTLDEALETTKIHSVAGKIGAHKGLITQRPFRSPHHTASQVALIGGGSNPQPGEVSLAHNGIMFADELPEFGRSALEVLRQPMEDKKITISRAKYTI
ncbi:MAG: YifB family Mg chelatase-like AAA ATPase, partial [Rikenellaceae bacterium]|nr:YifB family Mg chelatase-like AAA ATPase [Rikenellaceae bacterium]